MKHARPDYSRIQDPANIIPADEPVFLLRAQDRLAPTVVRKWADLVENSFGAPEIVSLARLHASAMEEWQRSNGSKIPDLPPRPHP
jgi:hypothetical protein